MFEKLEQCPVCDHRTFTNFLICKDHSITQESFAIVSCSNCGFKFTNPRPTQDHLASYYQSENYISHSNKSNSLVNLIYKVARIFTINSKVELINSIRNKGYLLDYGCGTGDFLQACKKNGWEVTGIEPNDIARESAQQKIKKKLYNDIGELKPGKDFDIITLWHVLEHISDLKHVLQQLSSQLVSKGILLAAVPNYLSYDAKQYESFWAGYDVPRHLYHFDQKTIQKLMATHQLKLLKVVPQKLDAFYVSLLSEKYKCGKHNFINAFKTGMKSNRSAKKNNGEYSSIIYVFQKD